MSFKPILDFLLVRRIVEQSKSTIVTPDSFVTPSNKATVVAIGDSIVRGGVEIPLTDYVKVGDTVLISQYGAEDVEIDGEKLVLVRLQDVKGVERGA
jgi:co-chaperonin GroES (HSP10)